MYAIVGELGAGTQLAKRSTCHRPLGGGRSTTQHTREIPTHFHEILRHNADRTIQQSVPQTASVVATLCADDNLRRSQITASSASRATTQGKRHHPCDPLVDRNVCEAVHTSPTDIHARRETTHIVLKRIDLSTRPKHTPHSFLARKTYDLLGKPPPPTHVRGGYDSKRGRGVGTYRLLVR